MKSAVVNCGLFVEIRTKLVSVVAAFDDSVADKIPPCIHHRHQLHQNTSTDYTFGSPLQIPNSNKKKTIIMRHQMIMKRKESPPCLIFGHIFTDISWNWRPPLPLEIHLYFYCTHNPKLAWCISKNHKQNISINYFNIFALSMIFLVNFPFYLL